MAPTPTRIFVSYAEPDEAHYQRLGQQLALLEQHGQIVEFSRSTVSAGTELRSALSASIAAADIILILMSPDYWTSPSGRLEVELALDQHRSGRTRVVPILLRHCLWEVTPFGGLMALPIGGRTVTEWPSQDEAWAAIARAVAEMARTVPQTCPRPAYLDDAAQMLAEAIDEARARRLRLAAAGADTADVRREIRSLRRQLREGGLRPGDALGAGRYTLLERIGRGGFGTVWKGFDNDRRTIVAIKVLLGEVAMDPVLRERFFHGAHVMQALDDEAIIKVFEPRAEDGGFHYFVMEYAENGNLRQLVINRRIPRDAILALICRVGAALKAAHAKGFIHRDVKPSNIVLDSHLRAKLTDFDLVSGGDSTAGTRTGALGTFLYAAPEMLINSEVDHRADIYGLAMTAIFCLYGRELPMQLLENKLDFVRQLVPTHEMAELLVRAIHSHPSGRIEDVDALCSKLVEEEARVAKERAAQEHHVAQEREGAEQRRLAEARLTERLSTSTPDSVITCCLLGTSPLVREVLSDVLTDRPFAWKVLAPSESISQAARRMIDGSDVVESIERSRCVILDATSGDSDAIRHVLRFISKPVMLVCQVIVHQAWYQIRRVWFQKDRHHIHDDPRVRWYPSQYEAGWIPSSIGYEAVLADWFRRELYRQNVFSTHRGERSFSLKLLRMARGTRPLSSRWQTVSDYFVSCSQFLQADPKNIAQISGLEVFEVIEAQTDLEVYLRDTSGLPQVYN